MTPEREAEIRAEKTADSEITGWRADPLWRLVSYDPSYFTAPPPNVPLPNAELAQPPAWASLYDGCRIVATWSRV